jgi:extracellular elastinolytic metalloproteinase
MPGRQRRMTLAVFGVVAALVLQSPAGGAATGAQKADAGTGSFDSYAEGHGPRDKDNRAGMAAPSANQIAAANQVDPGVRWNALGTPHALGPVKGALATGLDADPQTAARQYLARSGDLFGLDEQAVAGLETLLVHPMGKGTVVQLRQRFGDLEAGYDGLVSILVSDGSVLHVSSSLSRDTRAPEPPTISAADAVDVAVRDAGLQASQIAGSDSRLVAVPTPADGPRAAHAVTLTSLDGPDGTAPTAFTTYVDARAGEVLVREDLVDFDSDNPQWAVFPSTPPGPRQIWCFAPAPECSRTMVDPATGQAYDVDIATGTPTFTSRGNSANTVVNWGAGTPPANATVSPTRDYIYPFTDQWREARCDPAVFASPQRNDADAAIANLFVMHNRMHDWAFHLGFTEAAWNLQAVNVSGEGLGGDAEQGRAQANAIGGSRNNANQGTPRDGLPPTTNMFLWQPIAGTSYPPCVDGDYDMTVIGHEYTHAITNRMIAGPNTGIGSFQGGAMGESWGDMMAGEYLFEYGLRPPGNSPFITGGYVTGNLINGIRNYDMTRSPLNYSDVGYDRVGSAVHQDGEIWSATNMRIRSSFLARYGEGTPSLQARCADGLVNVNECPGNRRWAQLVFDSFLLQASNQFSMLDMRDNMLAADLVRFGGANQDIMWNRFAESGMGQDAASGPSDTDPVPSFASPYADNATVTLRPVGESLDANIRLYVGDYEARAVPVADTDPETAIPDTFQIVPNTRFQFVAVGAGYGHRKFTTQFLPGRAQQLPLNLPRNLASTSSGAAASGDGVNLERIVDDTEATNWASLDGVAGKQVTVDLAGDRPHAVRQVNVSAMLRPEISGDVDAGPQNAFSALRSFEILTCNAAAQVDCSQDSSYRLVYTSARDAFPAGAFRPFTPQINLRSFNVHPSAATHLRVRVVASQCTGNPLYAGEQDNDPRAATDCATASPFASQVRIAEVQAFTR